MRYLSSSKSKLISIFFSLLMMLAILPASSAFAVTNDGLCSLPEYQNDTPGSGGGYSGTELEACMFGAVAGRGNENINVCDKYPKVDTRREACQWGYNNFSKADGTVSSGPQDTPGSNGNTPSDNEHAQKTKEEVCSKNPDDSICKAGEKPKDPQCGELMESIGWWLCGPLTMGTKLADEMFKMFSAMLVMDPLPDPNNAASSTIYKTWVNLRDIANALLVLVFLIVIISQVSNLGISNYGIKKLLPRLIIIAVLINTSYFILQLVFDLSNILGASIDKLIMSTVQTEPFKWDDAMLQLTLQSVFVGGAILGTAAAISIGGPSILLLLAMLLLPALLSFVGAIVAIFMRNLLVPIIAVLAPVALAASILPNTKSLFDKWMKIFIGLVFLYPLATIFFSALKFGAAVAQSQANLNSDPLTGVLAQIALMIGSGFTVYLALKSNSIASKIMGGASGALKSMTSPARKAGLKFSSENMALRRKSLMNDVDSNRGVKRLFGRGMNRLDKNRRKRELNSSLYDAKNTEEFNKEIYANPGMIGAGLEDSRAAQSLLGKLEEQSIEDESKALVGKDSGTILAQAQNIEIPKTQRMAAVRHILKTGSVNDYLTLAKKSTKYGAGSQENAEISAAFYTKGIHSVLGSGIGDKILGGKISSDADIDASIAETVASNNISAEALTLDSGLTQRVADVVSGKSNYKLSNNPFATRDKDTGEIISVEDDPKLRDKFNAGVQVLGKRAELVKNTDQLNAKLKGTGAAENIEVIINPIKSTGDRQTNLSEDESPVNQ